MSKREKTTTAINKNLKRRILIIAAETDREFCEVLEDLIIKGMKNANISIAA
jgi:hypothetical protein